jgi:hypothetical protein
MGRTTRHCDRELRACATSGTVGVGRPLHLQLFLDVLDRNRGATRPEEAAQRERRRAEADGADDGDARPAELPEDEARPLAIAVLSDPLHPAKVVRPSNFDVLRG